jgi:phage/plasmid-associated DNA primase
LSNDEEQEIELSLSSVWINEICQTLLLNGDRQYRILLPRNIMKEKAEEQHRILTSLILSGCEQYKLYYGGEDNLKSVVVQAMGDIAKRRYEQAFASKEERRQQQQQQEQQKAETDVETKVRELTETLESRYHFAAMQDTEELFYYNEDNEIYEPAEALVKAQLEGQYPGVITNTVTNVIQKLARRHLHKREAFDADLYILNMVNGLYDIRTNTLLPHTWEYLSKKQIPITFDPKIKPKKFGKFLSEVNYPNQIRTTIESIAYTFLRDNPFEIYVILLGFGSNGKSVLMHVLTKLHGEDNVSNTSLARLLSDRFAKIDLEGKNVNLDMEMSKATIDDMSVLKELTGAQPHKGRTQIQSCLHY